MKILFDITHPMHVHLFKNVISELSNDHEVMVTSREKDITTDLLDAYGIDYIVLSATSNGISGTIKEWVPRALKTVRVVRQFDPDVLVSRHNPVCAIAAKLTDCTHIVFDESERDGKIHDLIYSAPDQLHTPTSFTKNFGENHYKYDGFHELAYLHPAHFSPDPNILREYGVNPTDTYSVLRFVAWDAHHDFAEQATRGKIREELIEYCSQQGEVYVSTECKLNEKSSENGIPVPPHLIHHLLFYADIHITDSGTMPIEAGLLGTPAICFNPIVERFGAFQELTEKYEVIHTCFDIDEIFETADSLLADPSTEQKWKQKRERIIEDNIDLTSYIIDIIESIAEVE